MCMCGMGDFARGGVGEMSVISFLFELYQELPCFHNGV